MEAFPCNPLHLQATKAASSDFLPRLTGVYRLQLSPHRCVQTLDPFSRSATGASFPLRMEGVSSLCLSPHCRAQSCSYNLCPFWEASKISLIRDVGVFLLQSPLVRRPLGHPAVASSLSDHGGVLWPRPHFGMQAHPLLRPSCSLSGFKGASSSPGPPAAMPRPFCVGRSLRRARRPPKAPPRATKGRLEPRTAPPVPGCGSLTGESCAAPEPRPELPPARVPPPRGRQPQPERLPGAHSSHHLFRRFTKWPTARSAAPRSRRGGTEWRRHGAGRRKRAEVLGQSPGSCGYLWRENFESLRATFAH